MTFFYDGASIQNRRTNNMDSLLLKERDIGGNPVCILAVCDGVGGLPDGAFASSSAVRMLSEWFDGVDSHQRLGLRARDAVLEINRRIVDTAREKGLRTGTTLSILLLSDGKYYIVHTGDSRIYLLENRTLKCLTEDQAQSGRLTACLGSSERTNLYYNEGTFIHGPFLICSDGLYKRVTSQQIQTDLEQISRNNTRKTVERLLQHALEQGEHDNISLAVVWSED